MQTEFNELTCEIRSARLTRIAAEENLNQVPVETTETWSSYLWRPLRAVFKVFSSTGTQNEQQAAERLQRMKAAGGDGSWRL